MSGANRRAILLKCSAIFGVLLVFTSLVRPERLPIKTYTISEGLAQNAVNRIFNDSRGFLWFCTDEGLSRFDGYTFTNYTTAHGLSHPIVKDVLETRSGIYWVGTGIGVCRFKPKGYPRPSTSVQRDNQSPSDSGQTPEDDSMFVLCNPIDQSRTGTVNVLLEDRTGTVWCGASSGLYRIEPANGQWTLRSEEIGLSRRVDPDVRVRALLEDAEGSLWIGAGSGLYRRWSDGRSERYTTERGLPDNEVRSLMMDAEGQLWVGTRRGVCRIDPRARRFRIIELDNASGEYLNRNTRSLFQSSTGQLLVGTTTSLLEFVPQGIRDASSFRHYLGERLLNNVFVQTMTEDRDGNLWIGTDNGALKLARNGFTTYTEADGLSEARVSAVFESRDGQIGAMTLFSSARPVSWFDGKRFNAIRPILPRHIQYFGWGWHQLLLQDHAGEWWLPTGEGLARYPKLSHVQHLATTPPKAIYTTRNGLVSNDVFRLFEDSRGDMWIATYAEARSGISRWERATDTFHHYGEADGLGRRTPLAHAFAEDRAGNLWIAFEADTVARFDDGRFTLFASEQGLPAGFFYDLHLDHAGRLWIASTTGGLTRVDEPGAEQPRFLTYTTAQGLSSNNINCITEDLYGRLYVGTGRGLDRLEPATGRVKPFTEADGLISGEVLVSFRDQKGDLWFGGKGGLSRLSPQPDPPRSPPPVLITGLRVAGEAQRISALGETEIPLVELGPDKDQIQIDFVALGFSAGEGLRYQYKLEGASEDWSQLADRRTVNFANLASGSYRFLVRAVNGDGVMSDPPASYSFTIYPALWKRGWFISINGVLLLLIAYALYRYRVRRLLELERVRTRIASDLHDDIGANLTKIGILSEVLRQQSNGIDGPMTEPLSSIARISRESVASMSDIVWAINPRRDTLRDLTRRMREFGGEIFANRDIEFELRAPSPDINLKLGADLRRAVFLIFKEAVNNIVRHSDCDKAVIGLRVEGNVLVLTVEDNGKGFDATRESGGNGLANIRNRAASMRGKVEIRSDKSSGTQIVLRLPIRQGKPSFAKQWF